MARFIATHGSASHGTQDGLFECGRKIIASLPEGTEWLNSWWIPESGKLLCEWEAPDPDAVRTALEPAKDLFPIETIQEVQWADPQWYK